MFERFTDDARRALTVAQEEARQLGHDFIGTEHLLLGLLAAGVGAVPIAFAEVDVTLDEARVKVQELIHPSREPMSGSPPFTPLAKKALEMSLREALQLSDDYIGQEHLLLGLTVVPDGGAAQVLAELAGNVDRVRQAMLARLGKPHAPAKATTSRRARLWSPRSSGGSGPPGPAPRCSRCNAPLVSEARYRIITVPMGDDAGGPGWSGDEERPAPVSVTVVYCGQCGGALGMT
jgi:ATP-dependent Clp protease ATP-binding subunit ClpA